MAARLELFDLTGRVALVTGGATGIGLSLAKGLATAGASVFIVSRNAGHLQQAVQEIIAATGNDHVAFGQADLAKRQETESIVAQAVARFGRLDILIGNAGQDFVEQVANITDARLDQQLEVNLASNIILARAAIPELKKHGCGRIVFITSVAADRGAPDGLSVYAATKSGLHAFARMAALELGSDGITVNCLSPGFTMTEMLRDFFDSFGEAGEQQKEIMAKTTAMNRWGRPEEMVGPVLMLVSDAGSFVTGIVLTVDGGTTARMK